MHAHNIVVMSFEHIIDTLLLVVLPGWKQAHDAKRVVYYYNKELNISQYERPLAESPPLPPPLRLAVPPSPARNVVEPSIAGTSRDSDALNAASARGNYFLLQRDRELARIRGMLPYVTGKEKAELSGELCAMESDLYYGRLV